ncbi:OsmC family protein [Porifericola rhodea]|uniref:OsmC family protein n=1 Tax=Porifericola rhodea TaxID=930972 RepID=UPI002664E97A|nr:OsmC family protein [Porifericola rhodea]WKN32256.1 OsmC family protein [Porifericola rhodea]
MALRKANAEWNGGLKSGKGNVALGSGAFEGAYSFQSRFEEGNGTNPEELVAAAHAGCFSMALSAALEGAGYSPKSVKTEAQVSLVKEGEGFAINKIKLITQAKIADISKEDFQKQAQGAKENCPISKVLTGTNIELEAKLL